MILAIDGYEANTKNRVGIGRFAFEILQHIYTLVARHETKFSKVIVYLPEAPLTHMPQQSDFWQYKIVSPKQLWTFFGLPKALKQTIPVPDVIFSPTHYVPRFTNIPKVMAIMDVSYLRYPELFRRQDLHKLVNWTAYSVRHSEAIITISEFSKRAIIDAYNLNSNRVTVAYPALSHQPMGVSMDKSLLPKKYILSVGTLQPRKNFSRLIEAFSSLPDSKIHLVIAGKKGWLYEEILASPEKYGVKERVHFLEYISDNKLQFLYKGAICFVLPSLYEGFGLPVLEAMSYGLPVVVSNSSSLPEIAGNAGIYVDPLSTESIAQGLQTALSESADERKKRMKLGDLRVKEFSWDKAAKTVMEKLESVAIQTSL